MWNTGTNSFAAFQFPTLLIKLGRESQPGERGDHLKKTEPQLTEKPHKTNHLIQPCKLPHAQGAREMRKHAFLKNEFLPFILVLLG